MSNNKANQTSFKKGHTMSQELRNKISFTHKGIKRPAFSSEWREKMSKARIGKKLSEETREKMRESHKGKKSTYIITDDVRKKMSLARVGKKLSEETKRKMSISAKKNILLGKCHLWQGGKSFEPYSIDWTKTLKISIRERDKYTCICGEKQGDITFDIHHIDYNKKNCNPDNLITLCKKCHMKTNHNRDYWTNYFIKKIWQNQ